MPKAYIVGEVTITDPEAYGVYRNQVLPTIEAHGGRFVIRGGPAHLIEGSGEPGRIVVIEFPDQARARAWYNSPEYQAILPLRTNNSSGRLVLVDGV